MLPLPVKPRVPYSSPICYYPISHPTLSRPLWEAMPEVSQPTCPSCELSGYEHPNDLLNPVIDLAVECQIKSDILERKPFQHVTDFINELTKIGDIFVFDRNGVPYIDSKSNELETKKIVNDFRKTFTLGKNLLNMQSNRFKNDLFLIDVIDSHVAQWINTVSMLPRVWVLLDEIDKIKSAVPCIHVAKRTIFLIEKTKQPNIIIKTECPKIIDESVVDLQRAVNLLAKQLISELNEGKLLFSFAVKKQIHGGDTPEFVFFKKRIAISYHVFIARVMLLVKSVNASIIAKHDDDMIDCVTATAINTGATEPVDSLATEPVDIVVTEPVDIVATEFVDILATEPVDIVVTEPVDIVVTEPVDIVATEPVDIVVTEPDDAKTDVETVKVNMPRFIRRPFKERQIAISEFMSNDVYEEISKRIQTVIDQPTYSRLSVDIIEFSKMIDRAETMTTMECCFRLFDNFRIMSGESKHCVKTCGCNVIDSFLFWVPQKLSYMWGTFYKIFKKGRCPSKEKVSIFIKINIEQKTIYL